MERLRVVGVDADASVPDEHGWTMRLHMTRSLTELEHEVLDLAWRRFRQDDTPPVVNRLDADRADVLIRVKEPEALAVVVPKVQQVLALVHEEAKKLMAYREANRQRVRDAAATVDWSN